MVILIECCGELRVRLLVVMLDSQSIKEGSQLVGSNIKVERENWS